MKRPRSVLLSLVAIPVMAAVLWLFSFSPIATAANPTTMSFQGKVVNADGTNVADGTYAFLFKIYTVSSGGTAIWTETQSSVNVTAGVFQVDLGSIASLSAIDFSANPNLYLGITFNSDPAGEMTPRVQLQSVPFAFQADNASKLGGRDASGYVQLSPSGQQTGSVNVSGNGTYGGNLAVSGTYNGNTFTSSTLTLSGVSANSINGANNQILTLQSQGTGALILQSATGSVSLGTSTKLTNSGSGLEVLAGGTGQNLSLNAATTGKILIGSVSSGDVEIAGQGSGNVVIAGGSGSTGCTITNSTGTLTCAAGITALTGGLTATAGSVNASAGTIQTAGVDRIDNNGNLTNIGTISAASDKYTINTSGDQIADFTQLDGSSTTTGGSGLGSSTNMALTNAANFDVGNYVQLTASNCGGSGINPCYAKITKKVSNTLTITPALTWTAGSAVIEYHIPEIGGTDTAQTLTNRYGRGYFIGGVATGNGTTYYSEEGISSSLTTFDLLNTGVTTLNIGGAATAINVGATGTTTTFAGGISVANNGGVNAGTGTLQGTGGLSVTGSITLGSLTTAGVLHNNASGQISSGAVVLGTETSGNYVASLGTLTGLSASVSTGAGISPNLSVLYGSGANTAVQGNTQITCTGVSGSNLSGGGNSITLGSGGSCNSISLTATPIFTSVSAPTFTGSAGVTLSSGGTSDLTLASASNLVQLTATTIKNTNTGLTHDLSGAGAYTFAINNSGSGTADLNIAKGALLVGGTSIISSARVLQNVTANTSILTSGTLGVARGGTGLSSLTTNSLLYANGTTSIGQISGTSANVLLINASGQPTFTALSGDVTVSNTGVTTIGAGKVLNAMLANSAITINNGSNITGGTAVSLGGSITIGVASSPNFAGSVTAGTGLTVSAGGASIGGDLGVTGGNVNIQQTGTGAALVLDRTDGVIASLKTGGVKGAFLFDSAGSFSIGYDTRANIAAGNTAGTDVLTALANGNVGIGASPGYRLDVQGGDFNASANIRTGGAIRLDSAGNLSNIGTLTAAGLIKGTAGLTITGAAVSLNVSSNFAVNIGTGSSTGAISLGGGSNTFAVSSTGIDISTAGAVTGVTTLTTSGAINGQTISSAADFSGTVDAASGFKFNGTAGQTFTCGNNQYVNQAAMQGGIITGHSACSGIGLSDGRLKTNIVSLDSIVLERIQQVRTVNFDFDCSNTYFEDSHTYCDTEHQTGVIAQELQGIFPDLVTTDDYGYYHVNYQGLGVYNLKATIELANRVDAIEAQQGTQASTIIASQLISNGALEITAGSQGDVSIDAGSGAVDIATQSASAVNISRAGAVTNVKGALATDGDASFSGSVNMNFSAPEAGLKINNNGTPTSVSAAIEVVDGAGVGYDKVIKSTNFSVAGSGDIATNGSIISKGGTLQIVDGSGVQAVTFDATGNGSIRGNLNLASATLTGGLTIGGDVNVAGLSTFQKLATFLGKTVFRQDVQFDGHITVAKDSAGYATLRTNETTVHVTFTDDYAEAPIVSANITNGLFAPYTIDHIDIHGFDITLKDPASSETKFNWTAIGVNDPQTALNPTP